MCSKQFWEQHAPFLATQKMIIMMSTITLLQLMGIIPTKGTCRNARTALGEKFKSSASNHMYWCSHCASKTYIHQNTVLENLNLSFVRFVMLVYSFSARKTTHRPLYDESLVISAATPLSQLRRHGSHSSGQLISLSLVGLQHYTFVQSWSTCPEVVASM